MEKEKKITKREQFVEIEQILREDGLDELADAMKHEIELLDKKSAKAKERAQKTKAGSDELAEAIFAALTDEYQTIAQVADVVGETTAKVQYRLTSLVRDGRVAKEQIKITDAEGKNARKAMGYKVAEAEVDEEA